MAKLSCSYNIISTNSSKFYKDIEEKIKNNLANNHKKRFLSRTELNVEFLTIWLTRLTWKCSSIKLVKHGKNSKLNAVYLHGAELKLVNFYFFCTH